MTGSRASWTPFYPVGLDLETIVMNCVCSQRGVTLIELLITVAVLGIIAGLAIPAYTGYISSSRNTEGWNNLASIRLAQEEYFLENNRYFPDPNGVAQSSDNSLNAYWIAAEGTARNFDYAVSTSGGTGYTATATGRGGTYTVPDTVSFSISN